MADEVGLSSLTLAALAERLGVRQPSLYKHVAGTDGLRRSISLRAKGDLATVLRRADRRVALVAMRSTRWRTRIARGPGITRDATRRLSRLRCAAMHDDEVASAEVVQVAFDVMAGYGSA